MARPIGSRNRPKVDLSHVGGDTDLSTLSNEEINEYVAQVDDYSSLVKMSIRQLRQAAILAGARLKFPMSRTDLMNAIAAQGGEVERAPGRTEVLRADDVYEAFINGQRYVIGVQGDGTITLDDMIDDLIQFRDQADAHFDAYNDQKLQEEAERLAYIESVKDFDGTPPEPTYDQKRIIALAGELGIRNADLNGCIFAVAEAYGVPLGTRTEDGNVMFPIEEIEVRVIKAMEKPL